MSLHMIRYWHYLAFSKKVLAKYQDSHHIDKIIDKFNGSRIQTEMLNNFSLFSFRIGKKERVICKVSKYEDKDCLVIVDIFENHEYDLLKNQNKILASADDDFKIVAATQETLSNSNNTEKMYYTLPKLASTNLYNKTIILGKRST